MRALFSSWCDEYYNLRILLIGEFLHKFRFKAIIERRRSRRKKLKSCLICFMPIVTPFACKLAVKILTTDLVMSN